MDDETLFARRYGGNCTTCGVVRDYHQHVKDHAFNRARVMAEHRIRSSMLRVRRAFGIGCTCPTGANKTGQPNHHFACGVNARAWG